MKSAESGTVAVIVIVVRIIAIAADGSCGIVHYLHVGGDHGFAASRIVGQRAEEVSVFVSLVNDGIGLHSGVARGRIGDHSLHFVR